MDQIQFETPEQIAIEYDVARLGSRFIAGLWDQLIITIALIALYLLAYLAYRVVGEGIQANIVLAIATLVTFIVYWGYFVLFEAVWDGQTPGKRLVSLRTIHQDGYPIGFGQSALRNLVRFIDMFPGSYGIGMLTMFFNGRARRLGDIAAGTIVVHDRRTEGIGALRATATRDAALLRPELSGLRSLSGDEVEAVRRLLQRRATIATSDALLAGLATQLRPRLGVEAQGLSDLALLQRVVAQAESHRAPATVQMTGLPSL